MRFVVVGAGAVGGVLGGLLHRSGAQVHLVARGDHLLRIRSDGLYLLTDQGDTFEHIPASGTVEEVDWRDDDVALLAVKSDATPALLPALARVAPPSVAVVCVQNGVANEPTALRWFERVYGICVMAPTTHLSPGVVEAKCGPTAAILDVGRYPQGVDDIAVTVAEAISAAWMVSEPREEIMRMKYRKLLSNLGNAVDAALVRGDEADAVARIVREEGTAVLTAAGIPFSSVEEDRARRGDLLRRYDREGAGAGGSSSWQSLQRGTGAIETDYLNGEIVRLGRETGVPTPANETIRRIAVELAVTGGQPRSVDAGMILSSLTT